MDCEWNPDHAFQVVNSTRKCIKRKAANENTIGRVFRSEIKEFGWVIPDFLSLPSNKVYSCNKKHFANSWWCLDISFGGPQCEFFSIFLRQLCAEQYVFEVEVDLGFKKRNDEVEYVAWEKDFTRDHENRVCQANFQMDTFKNRKFELLPDGALTVIWKLKLGHLVKNKRKSPYCIHKVGIQNLSCDMAELTKTMNDSDIKIIVRGVEFCLHSKILEARVPSFKDAVQEAERMGILIIDDSDVDAFQEFIHFVYCGKMNELSLHTAIELYGLSVKFHIDELKSMCFSLITQMLSTNNFGLIAKFALRYNITDLLDYAIDYLSCNLTDIMETEEWRNFLGQYNHQATELLLKALKGEKFDEAKGDD